MVIPDDDLGRALIDAGSLVTCLRFVADGLANRLDPLPETVSFPVTGGDRPTTMVLKFPPRPSSEEMGLQALHETLPDRCNAVVSSFTNEIRFELAGTVGPVQHGPFSGSSAHLVVWQIAVECRHALARKETRAFVERVSGQVDFDQLLASLEAEYGRARRARASMPVAEAAPSTAIAPKPDTTAVRPATQDRSVQFADDAKKSAREWAELCSVDTEALRKRLERLKKTDPACVVEVDNPASREARLLYLWRWVRPVVESMPAQSDASIE